MKRSDLATMLLQLAEQPELLVGLAADLGAPAAAKAPERVRRARRRRRVLRVPLVEATDIDVARARKIALEFGIGFK